MHWKAHEHLLKSVHLSGKDAEFALIAKRELKLFI